jgi:hypothetical protein
VQDEHFVRGLREIEAWLADADKRRHGSLPATSDYFTNQYLKTSNTSNQAHPNRIAFKLPLALHSPDSVVFVSLGWNDLTRSLPVLGEADEQQFLYTMLAELNNKFALQLDLSPNTDWSCQNATDTHAENEVSVILAGSSHSTRLINHLESARLMVVDSTIPGFQITDSSVANKAPDIEEKVNDLDLFKLIIIIQLLENRVFQCKTVNGDHILPKKGADRKYQAEGELVVVNKDTLHELFATLQPVFKVKGDSSA